MRNYLSSQDGFITKDNHPFAMFATGVHKWLTKIKVEEETKVPKANCNHCHNHGRLFFNDRHYRCRCDYGRDFRKNFLEAPDGAYEPVIMDELFLASHIAQYPERMLKGFFETHKSMKTCCPVMYEKLKRLIPEVIGDDRAKKMWKEVKNVDNIGVGGMVKV
jgi:hypothetical protein